MSSALLDGDTLVLRVSDLDLICQRETEEIRLGGRDQSAMSAKDDSA
jgi:hypothetical protein